MYGPYGAPLSIGVFGQQKIGKTLVCMKVDPDGMAVLTPIYTNTAAAIGFAGVQPFVAVTPTLDSASAWLVEAIRRQVRPRWILADDFSVMAENTEAALRTAGVDGWDLIQAVRSRAFLVRDLCLYHLGASFLFTAHEGGPKAIKGRSIRAGPRLPGQLTEDIAGPLNGVARMVVDSMIAAPQQQTRFRTLPDAAWVQGDKTGALLDNGPANLAECLRAVGVPVPRAAGLGWQDDVAEGIATRLLAGTPVREVLNAAAFWLRQSVPNADQRHVEWAFYDGLDRAEIRRRRANRLSTLFGLDPNWRPMGAPPSGASAPGGVPAHPAMGAPSSLPAGTAPPAPAPQPSPGSAAGRGGR